MSEPHDPIDDWLSTDVELLQPRPGAFDRIHRTARRRKVAKLASTMAGVVVVVAAAATLPQVVAGLLPGHGSPQRILTGRSTSPSIHTSSPGNGTPSGTPSTFSVRPTPPVSQAGASPLDATGRTHRPAANFMPTSVTFAGTGSGTVVGAVIGQADCPSGPCTSLAGTPDYGRTWFKVGAPLAGPPDGARGVSQVRFADTSNGWTYGPELWATHNGGLAWKQIQMPGRVIDLSAISGRAFALVAYGCRGSGQQYAASCARLSLFSAPIQANIWHPVPGASTGIVEAPGGLQLSPQYGYLMTNGLLYTGPITGGAWHAVSNASPSAPPCLQGGHLGPWLLAPSSPTLFLVCGTAGAARPTLYSSGDQGRTWHRRGTVTESGTPTSLAVAPTSNALVLATSTGIYYSTDQKTWHRAHLTDGPGGGFSYIGMTTTAKGVAVPANPRLGEIFTTADGGLTWQPSVIG